MSPSRSLLLVLAALGASSLGAGCVVSYGDATGLRPEPLPPPNDFAEIEVRLEALVLDEVEVDRRDRLDAALDLLRAGRTMQADDQARVLRYLQQIVSIEERSQPMSAPTLFAEALPETTATFTPLGGGIVEEDLGGVEELGRGEAAEGEGAGAEDTGAEGEGSEGTGAEGEGSEGAGAEDAGAAGGGPRVLRPAGGAAGSPSDPVAVARSALEAGDPAGALAALEPCGLIDCGEGLEALRAQARDAWIHAERERAGGLYVRARSEPDPMDRRARLVEARDILVGLLDRFPDASQAEALRRNLELVQAELEARP